MISTTEAKAMIRKNIQPLGVRQLPLIKAAGSTLAEDVYAAMDIPPFPQSSMDGYAFLFEAWDRSKELFLKGERAAGDSNPLDMGRQNAVRIFTGAAVPPGADTVIMQEKTRTENGKLIIVGEAVHQGDHVRGKGSEIKAGARALSKGTPLTPAAVGFLAGIGIADVCVYPYPSVSLVITGNELQQPGTEAEYGKVYDSNSFALQAALHQLHIRNVSIQQVPDDLVALTLALQEALDRSDFVLLTGGVSVGDYDFVPEAARRSGVQTLFHKIRQRPGKPLYFGTKDEKTVFGLPGNPASVLTCFYMYVVPALERLTNIDFGLRTLEAPLAKPFRKATNLTHYLKGHYNGTEVLPLGAQESYRMHSFAQANCLIEIAEEAKECSAGSIVTVHLLPV